MCSGTDLLELGVGQDYLQQSLQPQPLCATLAAAVADPAAAYSPCWGGQQWPVRLRGGRAASPPLRNGRLITCCLHVKLVQFSVVRRKTDVPPATLQRKKSERT